MTDARLSAAQLKFLRGCEEFEKGASPRGLPGHSADHRVMPGLMQRGLIGLNIFSNEYMLSPQGRCALRALSARSP